MHRVCPLLREHLRELRLLLLDGRERVEVRIQQSMPIAGDQDEHLLQLVQHLTRAGEAPVDELLARLAGHPTHRLRDQVLVQGAHASERRHLVALEQPPQARLESVVTGTGRVDKLIEELSHQLAVGKNRHHAVKADVLSSAMRVLERQEEGVGVVPLQPSHKLAALSLCVLAATVKLLSTVQCGVGWDGIGWDGMGWDGMGK